MKHMPMLIRSGFFIITMLFISAYFYAAVYENLEKTPIDQLGKYLQDIMSDPAFVEAYESQSDKDERISGDIGELKDAISNIYLLKSKYVQGPIRFIISIINYCLYVVFFYLIMAFSRAAFKEEKKIRLVEVGTMLMPYWYFLIGYNLLAAVYAMATRQMIEYNDIQYTLLSSFINLVPFVIMINESKKQKHRVVLVLACALLVLGINAWIISA